MKKKNNGKEHNAQLTETNIMLLITKEIANLKGEPEDLTTENLQILTLPHPRDKRKSMFILNPNENTIQELLKFSQPYRSWFIGNTVQSDGKIFLSTNIDPLFLALPYIYQAKMASTLDQLIHDDTFSDATKLESLLDDEQLSLIADKKDCRGLKVWKFNEELTLSWLIRKVNKVAAVIEKKGLHVSSGSAVSNTYVKSMNHKEPPENYLRYAHGIVSDYLIPEISDKLLERLNLPPLEVASKKRKNSDIDPEEIKKLKKECAEKEIHSKYFSEDKKKEKNPRKNAKQAALVKAAAGTINISSFFKKK